MTPVVFQREIRESDSNAVKFQKQFDSHPDWKFFLAWHEPAEFHENSVIYCERDDRPAESLECSTSNAATEILQCCLFDLVFSKGAVRGEVVENSQAVYDLYSRFGVVELFGGGESQVGVLEGFKFKSRGLA